VHRFVALVQFGNTEAVELLRSLDDIERRSLGPEMEFVIELPGKRGIGTQLARFLRAAAAGAVIGGQSVVGRAWPSARPVRPWRPIKTVVVGSDGTDSASVAVDAATDLAIAFEATLHVVSAYRAPDDRGTALAILKAATTRLRAHGLVPVCHARNGDPAAILTDIATEYDASVIVVGSKGMAGVARIGGSVPNSVSHRAPCSVLVVRTV
jgi:nucleotide-binding universal stress UspA family protein